MYYTIYKVTNQIDGKFYIGSHKTKDLNDNYMGSGKYLKKAQKKYGIENFTKEILYIFETSEEMYSKEAEIVNEDFLISENTYNLKVGGFGGFDYINAHYQQMVERNKKGRITANKVIYEKYGVNSSAQIDYVRLATSERNRILHSQGKFPPPPSFAGKCHTKETKIKISKANSIAQLGIKNSQFGTRWIHSLELKLSRKIKKEEPLPEGWKEGRKIKFV
jgi:hypothetical protein